MSWWNSSKKNEIENLVEESNSYKYENNSLKIQLEEWKAIANKRRNENKSKLTDLALLLSLQKENNTDLLDDNDRLVVENQSLKDEFESLQETSKNLQDANHDLLSSYAKMVDDLKVFKEENKNLQDAHQNLLSHNAVLIVELNESEASRKNLQATYNYVLNSLNEYRAAYEGAEKACEKYETILPLIRKQFLLIVSEMDQKLPTVGD